MTIVRGIVFVVTCCVLFAFGGGAMAVALNALAPGYYPGVFPRAARDGYAADVGIGTGIIQGQMLGFFVGVILAVVLACLNQLTWSSIARALATLFGCAVVFGVAGWLTGWALAVFNPGYYRGIVSGGRQADFNPIDVGIGLGCSEGVILGVIVGGLVALIFAWRRSRVSSSGFETNAREEKRTQLVF